jgi:hypothetical protein
MTKTLLVGGAAVAAAGVAAAVAKQLPELQRYVKITRM